MAKPEPLLARLARRAGLVPVADLERLTRAHDNEIDALRRQASERLERYRKAASTFTTAGSRGNDGQIGTPETWRNVMDIWARHPALFTDGRLVASSVADMLPAPIVWTFRKDSPGVTGGRGKGWEPVDIVPTETGTTPADIVLHWIDRPTPERRMSMGVLLMLTVYDLSACGKAYWVKSYADRPVQNPGERATAYAERLDRYWASPPVPGSFAYAVERWLPDSIWPVKDKSEPRVHHFEQSIEGRRKPREIHPDRVVYICDPDPREPLDGIGWMQLAAALALTDEEVASNWLSSIELGGISGLVQFPESISLTETQRNDMRAHIESMLRAPAGSKVGIIDKGGSVVSSPFGADDVGYQAYRDANDAQAQGLSHVPPMIRGDVEDSHYTTAEAQQAAFGQWTIGPLARLLWDQVSVQLGPDFGIRGLYFVPQTDRNKFIEEGIEEVDITRAGAISMLLAQVAAGTMSPKSAHAQLTGLHGMTRDEALALVADLGTSFVAAPPALGFPMSKGLDLSDRPHVITRPPIIVDLARDDYGLPPGPAMSWWTPEQAEAEVAETPTRQGSQAQLARDVARESARLELAHGKTVETAVAELLSRQAREIGDAIAMNRGQLRALTKAATMEPARKDLAKEIDDLLKSILGDGSDILGILRTASDAAIADAFGLGGELVNVGNLAGDLLDAARSAWFSALEIRSKYMTQTTADAARRLMRAGIADGATLGELANMVESQLDGYVPGRALRIAQTEAGGAVQAGINTGYEAAGVEEAEWSATFDLRVRPSHQKADGQRIKMGALFHVGDDHLAHPRDMIRGSAEEVINCRCSKVPVI